MNHPSGETRACSPGDESITEVTEPDSGCHDENLDFGSEGDEEDEEGGRADEEEEERTHEHDG